MSLVPYLSDEQWSALPLAERALLIAAQECDRFKVREVGRNDGPRVREYLRSAGVSSAAPWCASFVTWCLLQAGRPRAAMPPGPASACNWIAWAKRRSSSVAASDVRRGDLFAWCDQATWRGHIGFVVRSVSLLGMRYIDTIEGNTDAGGSREGDGVYRRRRLVRSNLVFIRL